MVSRENVKPLSKPEPLNRPESLHALPQKAQHHDESVFGGKNFIEVRKFTRLLDGTGGDDSLRRHLAEKFGTSVRSERMRSVIKEMKEKIPEHVRRDGYITRKEMQDMFDLRHHGMDEYYERRKDVAEKANKGFTQQEKWSIGQSDKVYEEIKDVFGAGKDKDKKE